MFTAGMILGFRFLALLLSIIVVCTTPLEALSIKACVQALSQSHIAPPETLGHLSRAEAEIVIFLDEFHASLENIPDSVWMQVLLQIRDINFNQAKAPAIRFISKDSKLRQLTIPEFMIDGWRKVGLIGENGYFNFSISAEEVGRRFERESGLKVSVLTGSIPLQPHSQFVLNILETKIVLSELHDFFFHIPWLLDPVRREWFRLAARFDLLFPSILEGNASVLNALFEYSSNSKLKTLRGPFQLAEQEPEHVILSPQEARNRIIGNILELEKKPEGFEDFSFLDFVWMVGAREDERESWLVAVLSMAAEIQKYRLNDLIPQEIRDDSEILYRDLLRQAQLLKDELNVSRQDY